MKLVHDCVREVMLYLEENLEYNRSLKTSVLAQNIKSYSLEEINYTCSKLDEAGYISINHYIDGSIDIEEISYNGHQFLDTIRDNKIWKQVKAEASKLSGLSLPILQQLAQSIILKSLGLK